MAGLGSKLDDDDVISDINVTPLVDVSLVLLIIFLATSAIIVRAAIEVDLPRAASAGEAIPDSVAIVVSEAGDIMLNGESVDDPDDPCPGEAWEAWSCKVERLQEGVAAEVDKNPEIRALIAASRNLEYGRVMDVIDAVRLAECSGFSLNVQRESRE
jgi:biopolymer transport protein ExbD